MESLQAAIAACPQAKAVLFTYPTYDGIAGNLEEMARYAHKQGMFVLVDEAHGAHLPFCGDLPKDALSCGADCTAQSTHKLTGSLTQTSMLHCRRAFPLTDKVAAAMALVQSTSPHYWFLASLDSARRQLALHGRELVGQAVGLARQVRSELNGIDGLYSFGTEITAYDAVGAFDETKVTIDFSGLGMDGRQAEKLLRQEGVEAELTAGITCWPLSRWATTKSRPGRCAGRAAASPKDKRDGRQEPVIGWRSCPCRSPASSCRPRRPGMPRRRPCPLPSLWDASPPRR